MTGACAIISSSFEAPEDGSRVSVHMQLKAIGTLGIWISDWKGRGTDGLMVLLEEKAIKADLVKVVEKDIEANAAVLEIDIESAWRDMNGGKAEGNTNEIGVEIILS